MCCTFNIHIQNLNHLNQILKSQNQITYNECHRSFMLKRIVHIYTRTYMSSNIVGQKEQQIYSNSCKYQIK